MPEAGNGAKKSVSSPDIARPPVSGAVVCFSLPDFMTFPQNLAAYARDRLELSRRERIRFRLSPQISLEILLILAAERGSAPLTTLFDRIAAAEKSVRSHVRALIASGLIEDAPDPGDRRAKLLRLTPRGLNDLAAHIQEVSQFERAGAIRAHGS